MLGIESGNDWEYMDQIRFVEDDDFLSQPQSKIWVGVLFSVSAQYTLRLALPQYLKTTAH